jgi:hypothetical protein
LGELSPSIQKDGPARGFPVFATALRKGRCADPAHLSKRCPSFVNRQRSRAAAPPAGLPAPTEPPASRAKVNPVRPRHSRPSPATADNRPRHHPADLEQGPAIPGAPRCRLPPRRRHLQPQRRPRPPARRPAPVPGSQRPRHAGLPEAAHQVTHYGGAGDLPYRRRREGDRGRPRRRRGARLPPRGRALAAQLGWATAQLAAGGGLPARR